MKEVAMKRILGILLALLMVLSTLGLGGKAWAQTKSAQIKIKKEYRFVMIPILVQAWFDIVHKAAVEAADKLGQAMGTKIIIDYQAPAQADLVEQNTLLERAIATKPDGISIDCNDVNASLPILKEAQKRGIPLVLFVSTSPEGSQIPYISNNFYDQGIIEGKELLKRINYKGNVAILNGVPTNSAHADRFQALNDLFKQYPDVKVVATGFDYDDVEKAQTECARILSAHPELDGFAVVDAAGPVGLGLALKEANKVGKVKYVGIDDVPQLQELMRAGVLDLSIATRPHTIGRWITVSLMMQNLGIESPIWFNTGIGYLVPDMVKNGNIEGF
jgi:ribose transport system substrate-binding protein